MNDENMKVLTNIIGAVESGGQVYGRRDYSAYAAPYTNSDVEHTITLGWAQNYGAEAYRLILMIFTKNPDTFNRIDPTGTIKEMINGEHDWVKERWNPNTYQRYILLALIDSTTGHECQDELFEKLMKTYIADCEATYTKDVRAVMMYCEIRHLGGKSPADRIFKRCEGNYSLDNIMAALKKDQSDTSSDNQVGDKKFWTRHQKCKEFIEKYAVSETSSEAEETGEDEGGTNEMGYSRSAVVKQAQAWIGCKESNGSHKKIIDIYNAHKPLARNYKVKYTDAWCATFVSAVAIKCGYTAIIPTECGCGNMISLFQKLGEWQENDAYRPDPGDVIFYDWDDSGVGDDRGGADHVGIVEKVSGNTITVIEGNKNNAVGRRTLKVNGRYIRGYGLPKYTESGTTATTSASSSTTNLSKGSTGTAVKIMQTMLIACGYSCGSSGADGVFGNDTYNAVAAFQKANGLTVDGIYGPESKAKLESIYKARTISTESAASATVTARKKATAYAKKEDDNLAGTYITTDDLNCRNDAGVNNESLCIIPKGTKVKCYGYYSVASDGRKWLLIQFTLDGTKYTGFSSSKFLKKE